MPVQFVRREKTTLVGSTGKPVTELLWGDTVQITGANGTTVAKARGFTGRIRKEHLTDQGGLLEVYVIDVGQGDGVLFRTPDDKWHLVDAGVSNARQMTKRGVVNFLRWKFTKDLGMDRIKLENVILTHPDFDHYGGLIDLFSGSFYDYATDTFKPNQIKVEVNNFYHNGLARWQGNPKLGASTPAESLDYGTFGGSTPKKARFITEFLDSKDSFANPKRPFAQEFDKFAKLVAEKPKNVKRLTHRHTHLPGYGPGQPVTIRILGPIIERLSTGGDGLRDLGSDSETVNGHSVVLRLDYGQSRTLLTGDLNDKSQRLLLKAHLRSEFAVDVAKGCHHGSKHVDMDFLRAMRARATVISSGDNEDYAHPQPLLLGASGLYGRSSLDPEGRILPPLVYSTELARSTTLAYADRLQVPTGNNGDRRQLKAHVAQIKPKGRGAPFQSFAATPIATALIYGLVNVRTDGRHVMCATMKEKGNEFETQTFQAGVDAN